MIDFSIIVPTYNRVDEIKEFLHFANALQYPKQNFEVIVIDDGSQDNTVDLLRKSPQIFPCLNLHWWQQENSGPAKARNKGAGFAKGRYLLFADSDCLLPPQWLNQIHKELNKQEVQFFGGPDREHPKFNKMQKAISYAMTSFLTTGGIRGKRKKNFHPRSFNMGIEKSAFASVGGFSDLRFGEDIDLSLKLSEKGYQSRLFPKAWVYHKRRANLRQFFKQVRCSGSARINLGSLHPKTTKLVHLMPSVFTLGVAGLLLGSLFCPLVLLPLLAYSLLIYSDALRKHKSFGLPLLCVICSYTQLLGYGSGFLIAWVKKVFTGKSRLDFDVKKFYD